MGYNVNSLAQTTVLNVTPNGDEGAIWNSGAGMAALRTRHTTMIRSAVLLALLFAAPASAKRFA